MSQGNVDVLKLRARGKAKISSQGTTVSLKANDPVSALQAIARKASIKINLTPEEVERVNGVAKVAISISYADNLAGASEAAREVLGLAGQAHAAKGGKNQRGIWKMLGFVGLILILGGAAFFLAYKALEGAFG